MKRVIVIDNLIQEDFEVNKTKKKLTSGAVVLAGGKYRSPSRSSWNTTLLIVRVQLQLSGRSQDRSLTVPLVDHVARLVDTGRDGVGWAEEFR